MAPAGSTHVVLTHVEVIGDIEAFHAAWRAWIDRCLRQAPGLVGATLHREQTGRRLLLIAQWERPAAYETWAASDTAQSVEALFAEHAVRSARSRWQGEEA